MYVNELISAEMATRAGAAGQQRTGSSRLVLTIGRMRFQVLGGFVTAVAIPLVVRSLYETQGLTLHAVDNSLLGTVWAFLFGYFLFRKVTSYPGVKATALILPAFIASYVSVVAIFFLLRLDYSRVQFLASFLLTSAFFYGMFFLIRRARPLELAIVPGGDAERLLSLRFVKWRMLASPQQAAGSGGIVADLRSNLSDDWERFIADSVLRGRPVYNAKDVLESLSGRVHIEHLSENPFGSLAPNLIYASGKRHVDFVLAVAASLLLAPFLLLIALAIRIDSNGPALFRQQRMGYRGQPFTVFKFRTMYNSLSPAQDALAGQADVVDEMTLQDDPRITRLGRWLRKLRIDELPQIINVLRGEMSWIGPRPEALRLSAWYDGIIPFYRYRHVVRPGITGWAQVNQGHVTSLDDADLKLQYDFFYVKNFSLWLDILVLLRTVRVVLTGRGAK